MRENKNKAKTPFQRILLIMFLLNMGINLYSQNVTTTGVVTDQNNEPMIGVSVKVKGSSTGTKFIA